MVMVSKPYCENVVELLEWFETSEFFILVLERPEYCMDLYKYCRLRDGKLSELESRFIMKQVVKAARHCCDRGVFHRDIKPENILIDTGSLEVKLIDFGCGDLLKDEVYTTYIGQFTYRDDPVQDVVENGVF
ncbi:serine/threonine-protein kinase pim-1-like [Hemibagrus wyckioides]|uniref:serine/threonine-protein kinase pim-1-like n=1 Tax=Hemibagrus wyckioides TaxID=337641 RepID=UPI00266C84CD|nr:serine/threonine-protein kinase pim-1-like [Hemibagrus wyckioides]